MKSRGLAWACAALLCLAAPAPAQDAGEVAAARAVFEGTRGQAVALAARVQAAEAAVLDAERRSADLEAQRGGLRAQVRAARAEMAPLLAALARLGRVPEGALLAVPPERALEAARAGQALAALTREARAQVTHLRAQMEALAALEAAAQDARAEAEADALALREQAEALKAVEAQRRAALESLEAEYAAAEAEAARAARAAQDFETLLGHLSHAPASAGGGGRLALPVAGTIVAPFGAADALDAPAQGLTLSGRAGGVVTAPAQGVVRFAGPFGAYGNLLIVEHARGHHSLLAGLGEITAVPGQA
ncbi:MAG TPA: hypothetical protein DDX54_01995, partial [Rhodospirillaceae bacterium]|nr:hypothetical protein [Rhodospirillaceae bacterium]